MVETYPKLHLRFLRLRAIISQYFTVYLRGETGIEVGWASRFLLPPSPVRLYDLSVLRRLVLSVPASRYVTR